VILKGKFARVALATRS